MDWLFELPSLLRTGITLAISFGLVVLVLFIIQRFGVKALGGLTITAWFQGLKNAFFAFIVVGMVVVCIAFIPIYGFGEPVNNGLVISGVIFWLVLFGWFIFAWFSRERRAGIMLLDLIAFPNKILFFVMRPLALIFGFAGAFGYGLESTGYSRIVSIVFGFSAGAWFIFMGLSRIQIHENGILAYIDLIKWGKIESVEWVYENQKSYTLKLKYKGKLPSFLRGGAIPVPVEKKDKLDALFSQYLPDSMMMQNHS